MDTNAIKRVAISAAYEGGKVLQGLFGNIKQIQKKGAIDLVTEADLLAEKKIIGTIRQVFPDHAVWAEESGLDRTSEEFLWIIDPLDGTTNFAHELPIFSVSIAFSRKGHILVAIILNPVTGELFSAVSGGGAELNGDAIGVSGTAALSDSLLVTGFPYDVSDHLGPLTDRFARFLGVAQGVRRLGSAALDLCYTACGRFDGFWEQNLSPWDTAAGALIVQEAGGKVSNFYGDPFDLTNGEILATNGKLHQQMVGMLKNKGET
jgi:myo-inositol-1(or 4)-monophosphatase